MSKRNPPDGEETNSSGFTQSRRSFLRSGIAGVAGSVALGAGLNFMDGKTMAAESTSTPDAALKQLMEGNRRFVSGKRTSDQRDITILQQNLAGKQEPFASVLACADSRVPVEILFDQTIGDLFVTRLAGNMITPEIVATLEYGIVVLKIKVLMILGHSNCGAVKAAIAGKPVPGVISALYPHLQPAVDQAGPDAKAVTQANAKIQARLLSQSSPVVAEAIKEGQLKVVAGYYDIGSGAVTILD